MRPLLLVLALAAGAAGADIAQEYRELKDRRDRAAQELNRQSKRLQDAANDPIARANAGRAVEAAQDSLNAAQRDFDAAVRKMKPGDAIWVQETAVTSTAEDRYALKVPAVGDGVPVDPRSVGLGAGVGDFDLMAKPPPSIGAPGVGPQGGGPPPKGVVYGQAPGFANDARDHDPGAFMAPGAPHVRDPRRVPAPAGGAWPPPPEGEPPPPEEGLPFDGPLPEAVAQTGFVVFPRNETFPDLLAFEAKRPGEGSLKVLRMVAEAVKRGDAAGAAKSAELLARRHPDDPGVRRLAAVLALRRGRLDEADAHIRAALKIDPTNPEAWTVLAWVRLRQGRRAEAGEAARWALSLDPSSSAAAAALKASGVRTAAPPASAPRVAASSAPPSVAAPSPFLSRHAAPEPEAPKEAWWGAFVLAVVAVSGAALTFALKGLVWKRIIGR